MSYGRNFEFPIPPKPSARRGRFISPENYLSGVAPGGGSLVGGSPTGQVGLLPIGVPVIADLAAGQDAQGNQYVKLAPQGTLTTAQGGFGILVYEYGPAWAAQTDPYLTTYSDMGIVPLNTYCIVVKGDPATKILLRNTNANTFLFTRNYTGRTMVNGLGATPTVAVGDYLLPGVGDDTNGYWETTSTEAGAWAYIESVDDERLEVTATLMF
jgi:hypothetical protein